MLASERKVRLLNYLYLEVADVLFQKALTITLLSRIFLYTLLHILKSSDVIRKLL